MDFSFDRSTIFLISIAIIVVWMLARRLLGKGNSGENSDDVGKPRLTVRVNEWYQMAQDQLAQIDDEVREERSEAWKQKSPAEQLALANGFLAEHFGNEALRIYTEREKIRIASVWYIGTPHEETDGAASRDPDSDDE